MALNHSAPPPYDLTVWKCKGVSLAYSLQCTAGCLLGSVAPLLQCTEACLLGWPAGGGEGAYGRDGKNGTLPGDLPDAWYGRAVHAALTLSVPTALVYDRRR